MTDFTDHVGAAIGDERCDHSRGLPCSWCNAAIEIAAFHASANDNACHCDGTPHAWIGPDHCERNPLSGFLLSSTPNGPYTCLHRGHGLCGDCPSDAVDVELSDAAIAAVESAGERDDVVVQLALALGERNEALTALQRLVDAFPKLSREFSTAEQQACLRAAHSVLARMGRR